MKTLKRFFLYGCSEFGIKKAENYIKDLENEFQHLANNPAMGRNCHYIRNKLRAWNSGSHVIFFKQSKNGISIIRVLHQSMDYLRHI